MGAAHFVCLGVEGGKGTYGMRGGGGGGGGGGGAKKGIGGK